MPTEVIFTDSEPIYGEAPVRAGNFESKGERIGKEKSIALVQQPRKYEQFLAGLTPSWKFSSFQANSPNSCGPNGADLLVPDYFPECCTAHDIAYGTLGVSRLDADTAFLKCALLDAFTPGVIDMPGLNLVRGINRISAAYLMHGALRVGGNRAYQDAQEKERAALRLREASIYNSPADSASGNQWLP